MYHIYDALGIPDYKLRDIGDIKAVHGHDVTKLKGYAQLTEEQQVVFNAFWVNFFNGQGMGSRSTIIPLGVYYAEEISFYCVDDDGDKIDCGTVISTIDKNGKKKLHRSYKHDDVDLSKIKQFEPVYYLRAEYKHYKRREWLHVLNNGKSWY